MSIDLNVQMAALRAYVNGRDYDLPEDLRQVLAVAEEAGEFVGSFRRFSGAARRSGTLEEVHGELADVIISACLAAFALGTDPETILREKLEYVRNRPTSG